MTSTLLLLAAPPSASESTPTAAVGPTCTDPAPSRTTVLPVEYVEARLLELHALYADLPGFVDAYYRPDPTAAYRLLFVGEVPPGARDRAPPAPVAFDILPAAPAPLPLVDPLPSADDIQCTGIRPGARVSTPIGICTLSFIFTNGIDLFAGTAGHCIRTGQTASVGGLGVFGTAAWSSAGGGIGNDFALIRVNANLRDQVSAEMCDWAGPTGTFAGPTLSGIGVVHTGHGLGVVAAPPRPRSGVGLSWGATSFQWAGNGAIGDSGSAVRTEGVVTNDDGDALGTLTHGATPVTSPLIFGTRWDRGLNLANAAGLGGMQLVTVDHLQPV